MTKNSTIINLILGSLFFLMCGCATQQSKILPSGMAAKTFLQPNKFFEACVETEETNVKLSYVFESTKPIYFDIHYHNKQDEVFYLMKTESTNGTKGEVISKEPSVYCMLLLNKHSVNVGFDGDFIED